MGFSYGFPLAGVKELLNLQEMLSRNKEDKD